MPQLTEITTYDDVMRSFSWDRLWELFDGDRDRMNLAHECLDRHRDQGTAISVKFADGHREHYDYATLTDLSSRFANWLTTLGIGHGDHVAIVLDPGKAFPIARNGSIGSRSSPRKLGRPGPTTTVQSAAPGSATR